MLLCTLLEKKGIGAFQVSAVLSFGALVINVVIQLIHRWKRGDADPAVFNEPLWAAIIGDCHRLPLLFFRGFMGFGGLSFAFLAMHRLKIGDTNALWMTSPIVTKVLARVIFKEPMLFVDCFGLLLAFCGVVLITRPPFLFSHGTLDPIGVMHAFIGSFSAACVFIALRKLGAEGEYKTHWLIVSHWKFLGGFVLSTLATFITGQTMRLPEGSYEWRLCIAAGPLEVLASTLLTLGFSLENAGPAAAMRFWDVPFAYLWQVLFLHEHAYGTSILGAGMVATAMVSTMVAKWYRSRQPQSAAQLKKLSVPQANENFIELSSAVSSGVQAENTGVQAENTLKPN